MRPPFLFALLFASLCPFYAFGFPSVSPFWTASNLASFNNLRFDYRLGSRSAEWLILGLVLDADMVNALLRRDALRSVTAVQALCEFSPSNLDPKRNVPVQTSIMCSPLARTRHGQCSLGRVCVGKENFSRPCHGICRVRESCVSAVERCCRRGNKFRVCTWPFSARCSGRMFSAKVRQACRHAVHFG